MSPSAFWCQLLAFPLLRFWNQQALLKAQLLPGKDFISLCTSYPFRDRCHHGTIVGDHPVPVPSSAQLLQNNISTCFMANQRGVSSCLSPAFSCSIHTAASPNNTMVRDPRGEENLPCAPGRQELAQHSPWAELPGRWRSGWRIRPPSPHPILGATAWICFAPGGRKG